MLAIQDLLTNHVLITAILSWFCAQLLKVIIYSIKNKTLNPERLVGAGGMPSSHSATVCGLAMSTARVAGFGSPIFAIAVVFALVVIFDAMGVRRSAGEQAKVLNNIVFNFHNWLGDDDAEESSLAHGEDMEELPDKKLKEFIGHTPLEVLCGSLLGILIAILLPIA